MKDCAYQNTSNSSLIDCLNHDQQQSATPWISGCIERQQRGAQMQHNVGVIVELNEQNHQISSDNSTTNTNSTNQEIRDTQTNMMEITSDSRDNNSARNINNLPQHQQQYPLQYSSTMQQHYQPINNNNYHQVNYGSGSSSSTSVTTNNETSGNSVEHQLYETGTEASPQANLQHQPQQSTAEQAQELPLSQQPDRMSDHETNLATGNNGSLDWPHTNFSQHAHNQAYRTAFQQQQQHQPHHLQQHINQQEHPSHNLNHRSDQYGSAANAIVSYHQYHNQNSSAQGQLLYAPDQLQNRHSMATCLSGYPSHPDSVSSYSQSTAAAALYSSSLIAANAKAAMLHQHHTNYGQHQQQTGIRNHDTNQIDQHQHTAQLSLSGLAQDHQTTTQQQQHHSLWESHSLQANPLLDGGSNRMTAAHNHHHLHQLQQHQQQQSSSHEQNSLDLAVPGVSSCGPNLPGVKLEKAQNTTSPHEQHYPGSCNTSGSSAGSSSSSTSSVGSSLSFSFSASPADEITGNSVVKPNGSSVIKRLSPDKTNGAAPLKVKLAKRGARCHNNRNVTSYRQTERLARQQHQHHDQGQVGNIDESATYKDHDIEHTSSYIVVTNVKNGEKVRLSNQDLTDFSTRQLNKIVASFPKETVTKLKLRRRTLKNRGYAQNCRHKRLDQKNKLEKENEELRRENLKLRHTVYELRAELQQYKG